MKAMSVPKATYHHGDLRNALVEEAARAVREGGEDGFSLRETARTVGVSPNAAYRHFAGKAALLTAVAVTGFEELARRMGRAARSAAARSADEPEALARFKATGRAYVEFALAEPEVFRLMFGPHGLRRIADGDAEAPQPSPYVLLGDALDDLVRVGLLAPARREGAELKAWTVVHGFASLALEDLSAHRDDRARTASLEALLDFAAAGLCSSGRAPLPH